MSAAEMNALDQAFLCLEHPSTPMHIGAVAVFEPSEQIAPTRLTGLLTQRAQQMSTLRQRVHSSWFPSHNTCWQADPQFDASEHIHCHRLPWPGDPDELADLAAQLVAEPLDTTRPLWELHLITGLHGDRFAVLVKLHHALADGARAAELGFGLLDGFTTQPQAPHQDSTPTSGRTWWSAAGGGLAALARPQRLLRHALTAADETLRQTSQCLNIGWSVVRHAQLPSVESPLLAPPSTSKHLTLLALPLQDLHRIRARFGGTTHDVLLAVITGTLRLWLTSRGHPVDELSLRALLPVNCRPRTIWHGGNNQLSGYLCKLPVAEPDPVRRLQFIQTAMTRNKSASPLQGPGAFPVLAQRVPSALHRLATPAVGRCAPLLFDTVITHVPVPCIPATLDGAQLRELYPLVPLAAGHALSIAASPYRGRVHIGLQANRNALSDLKKLHEAFPHALAELADLAP